MTTDVASHAAVSTPRAVHRRRGWLLVAAAGFNLWLWITRIRNLIATSDSFSTAFVTVHAVLYVSAIVVALVVGVIGWRLVAETRKTRV